MNLVYILVYIYLLLKPYYLFESGNLQISDAFMIIALIPYLFVSRNNQHVLNRYAKNNAKLIIFVILVIIINFMYYIIFASKAFLLYSLYWVYLVITMPVFSECLKSDMFNKKFRKIAILNIVLQFVTYIIGKGNYFYDTGRYMGTFNDPNQFAFFVLLMYSFILMFNKKYNKKNYFLHIIVPYLILLSSSTGMMFGLLMIYTLNIYLAFKQKKIKVKYIVIIVMLLLLFNTFNSYFRNNIPIYNAILYRIENKINNSDNNVSIFEDRSIDKLYKYPQYLIFGSGEGYMERFSKAYYKGEIHSTLLAIWFYYGIVPFSLLLSWLYNKIKKTPKKYWAIIFAILIESFTVYNGRQLLFWQLYELGETEGDYHNE